MIINLTQHVATDDQIAEGVFNSGQTGTAYIQSLLTFEQIPSQEDIKERAEALADYAAGMEAEAAMIGGAPYLMAPLEQSLKARGITPLYAFSIRESVESTGDDGSIVKINRFRHAGFVRI